MRVACVIPWRGGQPDREHHHQVVRDHLIRILPDAIHLDADNGADPFSRAGSRNDAVHAAEQAGAEIVVLADADTLPEPGPLLEAIQGATGDGRLHLPYTWFRGLSEQGTRDYLAGAFPEECDTELHHEWATGGVLVIRPDSWWQVGGMDERCVGWGHEDVIFRICADAILGPTIRHDGTIVHLWHLSEVRIGSPQWQANSDLCARYAAVEGNSAAIRELIAERDAALTVN